MTPAAQQPKGMICARHLAGAQRPAPSTPAAGSPSRPDPRTGRSRARFSLLLPALALLLGALGLFAAAPAAAQTTYWSATLTVDQTTTYFGCDNNDDDHDNCSVALDDDDFTFGGKTYAVDCQSALKIDPLSACKIDPPEWHGGGCPGSQ